MKKPISLVFVFLFQSLFVLQAQADWRLGGGAQWVGFDDDLEDVDSGFGLIFSAAFQANDLVALDLQLGSSVHDENLADEFAFYGYAMVGGRLVFSNGNLQPYVALGLSFNTVDFDEFDTISGRGVYWGLGADVLISQNHSINVSYRVSDWDGEDDVFDYDVSNTYLGGAYNYRF